MKCNSIVLFVLVLNVSIHGMTESQKGGLAVAIRALVRTRSCELNKSLDTCELNKELDKDMKKKAEQFAAKRKNSSPRNGSSPRVEIRERTSSLSHSSTAAVYPPTK